MNNWTNYNYSLNKIDVKKTLQELHQKFPNLTIEDLFDILDCIKYEYTFITDSGYRTYAANAESNIISN